MVSITRRWANNTFYYHKKRGIKFENDVTASKLKQLMEENLGKQCIYCGRILSFDNERIHKPTLDIINIKKLITMDNLQIIDNQCNVMKGQKTHSQFLVFRQTPEYLRQVKCPDGKTPNKISGRIY